MPGLASPAPPRPHRRIGAYAIAAVVAVAVVVAALFAAAIAWSGVSLAPDDDALAHLKTPKFAASVESIRATDAGGHAIAIVNRDGQLYPKRQLAIGERVTVAVTTRRAGWAGWALGSHKTTEITLVTPAATVSDRYPTIAAGAPVRIGFDAPVRSLAISTGGKDRRMTLAHGLSTVSLGKLAKSGTVSVAAAPRTWEKLPKAVDVTWFPAGDGPAAIVSPGHGATFTPTTPITVTYSKLPKAMPTLSVDGNGRWERVDAHTVRYTPRGAGFGLSSMVKLRLPSGARLVGGVPDGTTEASWTVPPGSTARLQQLLADQGYLPLTFTPADGVVAHTAKAQQQAAVDAPDGTFTWTHANTPAQLKKLWVEGAANDITRGAVMAFESDHGLDVDGLVGPKVWGAIIDAEVSGQRNRAGYSYVLVHRDVPQSLTLWHDGKTLLTTAANSGVPAAPTKLGTFPVYLRLRTQTMEGTNPDGSHYSDPGIKWISYFNGGDAIHGFERASYGTPQSVGCVELPVNQAKKVWPYTPIGTLVTVAH